MEVSQYDEGPNVRNGEGITCIYLEAQTAETLKRTPVLSMNPEDEGHTVGAEPRDANSKDKATQLGSMLEEILNRRNIEKALIQVEANKGAGGIDGMKWEELRPFINTNWQYQRVNISEGKYKPSPVRKVTIPKPQGGERSLGIPSVFDRMLQQAINQWLTSKYEDTFSKYSYGFRPKRNAHQAVQQAEQYLNSGKTWVIELDLENFFDRVNHDRLMFLLSDKTSDKQTLKLIRRFLESGIMEGGVISPKREGTPQGSPLSPLLSNIVLDELDKELEKRGLSFVRYADDVSIYLSSERAADRVMKSVTRFIEKRLLLKVNKGKTKISKAEESTLLGFSFRNYRGKWIIRVSRKSALRIKEKLKVITLRSAALSEKQRIGRLNAIIRGWVNYFVIAKAQTLMQHLDGHVRTRLRMCKWKEWKKPKARRKNLRRLGINLKFAHWQGGSSLSYYRVARSRILTSALTISYYRKQGYIGFYDLYYTLTERQTKLF